MGASLRLAFTVAVLVTGAAGCSGSDGALRRSGSPHDAAPAEQPFSLDGRDCRVPASMRARPREAALRCAESFIARNGYTNLPPVTDSTQWTAEFMDEPPWSRVLADRHGTLETRAWAVCGPAADSGGYSAVFRYVRSARLSRWFGKETPARLVKMDSAFHGIHLVHQDLIIDGMRESPRCHMLQTDAHADTAGAPPGPGNAGRNAPPESGRARTAEPDGDR
jgi:hypothetical protein